MPSRFDRPAFLVNEQPWTWEDVRASLARSGAWARQEAETARAASLVAAAPPSEEAIAAAAREFRYGRDLVSGDDMRAWLETRGVNVSEWMDHVRRQVALASSGVGNGSGVTSGDLARAVDVDAICGGLLDRAAGALAGRLALTAAAGELASIVAGNGTDPASRVSHADAAFERVRADLLTPAAITAQLTAHRLEWMTVQCRIARFAGETAAREAVMRVREDGEPLDLVASDAHARLEARSVLLEDAGSLQGPLMGAAPGELLGPLLVDGAHALVEVVAKRLPDLADAATRERAERAVVDGRMAAAVATHVRWGA